MIEAIRVSREPSQSFTAFDSRLWTLLLARNYFVDVPYRYGARSDGLAAWNGTRRSANFAGFGCLLRISDPKRRTGQTTAEGADGSSACPGVSTHERGAEAQSLNPGTSSKPTNPSVCGTQAKGCFRGPVPPTTSLVGLNRCPCAVNFQTACGMLAWLAGGRGSGLLPSVPHRPLGGKNEQEETTRPVAELNTGR